MLQADTASLGAIQVYPLASDIGKDKARYSAYGVVDVHGDYRNYHQLYQSNTEKLEDDHFSRKVALLRSKTTVHYDLIFTHWLIGEIFRLREEHVKIERSRLAVISRRFTFDGRDAASMWKVRKYLRTDTKSSWVGDRFRYLDIYIAFIDMGTNRTRIFYRMILDAEDKRNQQAVNDEVRSGIANILKCRKK